MQRNNSGVEDNYDIAESPEVREARQAHAFSQSNIEVPSTVPSFQGMGQFLFGLFCAASALLNERSASSQTAQTEHEEEQQRAWDESCRLQEEEDSKRLAECLETQRKQEAEEAELWQRRTDELVASFREPTAKCDEVITAARQVAQEYRAHQVDPGKETEISAEDQAALEELKRSMAEETESIRRNGYRLQADLSTVDKNGLRLEKEMDKAEVQVAVLQVVTAAAMVNHIVHAVAAPVPQAGPWESVTRRDRDRNRDNPGGNSQRPH